MEKDKGGRPSKFNDLDLEQVKQLAESGWTDKQMSVFFKVTEQTWNNWKKAHPSFFESLKSWKVYADEKVERSLYERATGSTVTETVYDRIGDEFVAVKKVEKTVAPDTGAGAFWLKNRLPNQWRDTNRVEFDDKTEGMQVTDEKLDQMLDAKLEALNIGGEDVQEKA